MYYTRSRRFAHFRSSSSSRLRRSSPENRMRLPRPRDRASPAPSSRHWEAVVDRPLLERMNIRLAADVKDFIERAVRRFDPARRVEIVYFVQNFVRVVTGQAIVAAIHPHGAPDDGASCP